MVVMPEVFLNLGNIRKRCTTNETTTTRVASWGARQGIVLQGSLKPPLDAATSETPGSSLKGFSGVSEPKCFRNSDNVENVHKLSNQPPLECPARVACQGHPRALCYREEAQGFVGRGVQATLPGSSLMGSRGASKSPSRTYFLIPQFMSYTEHF